MRTMNKIKFGGAAIIVVVFVIYTNMTLEYPACFDKIWWVMTEEMYVERCKGVVEVDPSGTVYSCSQVFDVDGVEVRHSVTRPAAGKDINLMKYTPVDEKDEGFDRAMRKHMADEYGCTNPAPLADAPEYEGCQLEYRVEVGISSTTRSYVLIRQEAEDE